MEGDVQLAVFPNTIAGRIPLVIMVAFTLVLSYFIFVVLSFFICGARTEPEVHGNIGTFEL